jgi:sec-independent protein translocase protein TatB
MFDIGFPELILVAVVGLLVIGPERLPEALRTLGLWLGRMRRSFTSVKNEIEKEIGMDEVRRQLHNEAVMDEMKRIENEVRETVNEATIDDPSKGSHHSSTPAQEPPGETVSDQPTNPPPDQLSDEPSDQPSDQEKNDPNGQ